MVRQASKLTSTQIGAIAENLVANALMRESGGRLSPFTPVADDDGIDLLVYDKKCGQSIPLQVKARTVTVKKRGSSERGSLVHFQLREATFKDDRFAHVLAVLLDDTASQIETAWLIPMRDVATVANRISGRFVIRASRQSKSKDKWSSYRCATMRDVVTRLLSTR